MNPPLVWSDLGWPIIISDRDPGETVARALDASTAANIVKPFLQAEVTERVRVALRRRERPAVFVTGTLAIDLESRVRVADPTVTGGAPAPRCTARCAVTATATRVDLREQ
ncbi:MAG: hypothetical protein OXU19_11575 [bacterium]|nr:hypothetical protein [bacterium]